MTKIRLLVLAAATAACVAMTAPSAALADWVKSPNFSCAIGGNEWGNCSITVGSWRWHRLIEGSAIGSRGIWLDNTHAVHIKGGPSTLVDYWPSRNNPHWQWRACGWFYHLHAPRHIVCSPWVYEGVGGEY